MQDVEDRKRGSSRKVLRVQELCYMLGHSFVPIDGRILAAGSALPILGKIYLPIPVDLFPFVSLLPFPYLLVLLVLVSLHTQVQGLVFPHSHLIHKGRLASQRWYHHGPVLFSYLLLSL
jgi:hypothetical protein